MNNLISKVNLAIAKEKQRVLDDHAERGKFELVSLSSTQERKIANLVMKEDHEDHDVYCKDRQEV